MEYVLKNKNINVLTFEISAVTTPLKLDNVLKNDTWMQEIKNVNIIEPELLPLDIKPQQIEESLEKWIKHRKIPKNRQFVEKIISTYATTGSEQFMDYIDVSLGFGNFGMIINNDTNELLLPAPIFDNGFSLLNYLTLEELKDIENLKITKTSEMGYTFDEQMKLFIGNRHAHNLEKLTQFKFKKHPQFNISDEWLEPLQTRIQERAKTALNFINNEVAKKNSQTRKTCR